MRSDFQPAPSQGTAGKLNVDLGAGLGKGEKRRSELVLETAPVVLPDEGDQGAFQVAERHPPVNVQPVHLVELAVCTS